MRQAPTIIIVIMCLFLCSYCQAETYYVDYASGLDSNAGTSFGTAWKHCPGDTNFNPSGDGMMTWNAVGSQLLPGDTINFKGGVKYYGKISISWSGDSDNQIIYQGMSDGWGTGKAILSGAEIIDQIWSQCSSTNDCWDNSNWANIYYTTIPSGYTAINRLYQDGMYVNLSQYPSPEDPLFMWNTSEWIQLPANSYTITTITDAINLIQTDSSYWVGAYIIGWYYGNAARMRLITAFDPDTDTVTNDSAGGSVYTAGRYSLVNHPALIDHAGEYAYRPDENRLYLWTYGGVNPDSTLIEVAARTDIFTGSNKSYITIEGFKLTQTTDSVSADGQGNSIEIIANGGTVTGVEVSNCETYYLSGWNEPDAIHVNASSGGVVSITNNYIHDNFKNRGIFLGGGNSGSSISDNNLDRMSHTGVWVNGGSNFAIARNAITNIKGAHGNGLSIYSSSNMIVDSNYIKTPAAAFTYESCSNYTVTNNIIDGDGSGVIRCWQNCAGTYTYINNTIVNGYTTQFLGPVSSYGGTLIAYNNIIQSSGAIETHSHNIFIDANHPTLETGESVETASDLFVNYDNADYQLKENSPAVNTGADVSSYGIVTDYNGSTRPIGAYDIGAYEYVNPFQADFDSDNDVDIFDYNILLANFGTTGDCENPADADGDCNVGIFDYNILLEEFGSGT